jgi:hypothetical protein
MNDAVAAGEFDERMRMHSDWDFLIRLASLYRFRCVKEVLYRDHWHAQDQITKSYLQTPSYDRMVYERNRALFEADRKANALFHANIAWREGLCGRKREALRSIAKSLTLDPLERGPYVALYQILTNRIKEPRLLK